MLIEDISMPRDIVLYTDDSVMGLTVKHGGRNINKSVVLTSSLLSVQPCRQKEA